MSIPHLWPVPHDTIPQEFKHLFTYCLFSYILIKCVIKKRATFVVLGAEFAAWQGLTVLFLPGKGRYFSATASSNRQTHLAIS